MGSLEYQDCKHDLLHAQTDSIKSTTNKPLTSLERRRKIQERSEERMKKILGHSARFVDEDNTPCCFSTTTLKNDYISKVEVIEPSFKTPSEEVSSEMNTWPILIIFSVVVIKIITLLEAYEVIASRSSFSFIIPFLILEWFYLIKKSFAPMKTSWCSDTMNKSIIDVLIHKINYCNISGVIICGVLPMLDDIALHFSIYFVSLCLVQLF